jgi:hypothetical protein
MHPFQFGPISTGLAVHGPPLEPNSPREKTVLAGGGPLCDFPFLRRGRQFFLSRSRSLRHDEKRRLAFGLRAGATKGATREAVDLVGTSHRSDRRRELGRWIRLGPGGFPTNPAARTGERRFVPFPAGLSGGAASCRFLRRALHAGA